MEIFTLLETLEEMLEESKANNVYVIENADFIVMPSIIDNFPNRPGVVALFQEFHLNASLPS